MVKSLISLSVVLQPHMSNRSLELERNLFTYARRNLIKLNIYIRDPYVTLYSTEEKITEIAFVGMFGGIMGLFMGSSFVSAIEIPFMMISKFLVEKLKFYVHPKKGSKILKNKIDSG